MGKFQDNVTELFPFDSYRAKQKKTLVEAAKKLDSKRIDNVIINAPTGVGKSAINVALARAADNAFYITPQKKLRQQLQDDDVLGEYYKPLKARRDYTCGVTGADCDSCEKNQSTHESCSEWSRANLDYSGDDGWCTYWNDKLDAIDAQTTILTFAYLIVDGKLGGEGVSSFANRELLIVDECHNLESQVASLHMGFDVTPNSFPDECIDNEFDSLNPDYHKRDHHVMDRIESLMEKAEDYVSDWEASVQRDVEDGHEGSVIKPTIIERLESFLDSAEWFKVSVEDGNRWVVNVEDVWHNNRKSQKMSIKPVRVDGFLRNNVWNRAEKRILSTATMPYRDKPSQWCASLGLDPTRTAILTVGMPFPKENRPIFTGYSIAEMSGGGDDEHWSEIMTTLNKIADRHDGLNGLIHTASYKRAERVYDDSSDYPNLKNNVLFHQGKGDSDIFIEKWQHSDKDIVVTPSMTDGVDLYGDRCRWQVLLKVPFPSLGDSRVDYLLNEKPQIGWPWYYETTANSIIQSAGRAVRSKDDYASYYVLDESFGKVRSRVEFPDWFEEAIVDKKGRGYSALDW